MLSFLYSDTDSLLYHIKTKDIYEELCDENDKFDFSSYPKSHPNFTRNIVVYIDDNKPIIHNANVPANFKEDFNFEIPTERSVCKPKVGQLNSMTNMKMEITLRKKEVREYHSKLFKMNYNMMISKHV